MKPLLASPCRPVVGGMRRRKVMWLRKKYEFHIIFHVKPYDNTLLFDREQEKTSESENMFDFIGKFNITTFEFMDFAQSVTD